MADINHQNLIDLQPTRNWSGANQELPDAIYIPFLNRKHFLRELLQSLSWYEKEIFILVSHVNGMSGNTIACNGKVTILDCSKTSICARIQRLKTFKSNNPYNNIKNWDLPLKRNFALVHGFQNSFNCILLIDDDIEKISVSILNKGAATIKNGKYEISGCLIEGYPDTSVVGHLEILAGVEYVPYLSGSFLFVNPTNVISYFPLIYNEDWLFMVPSILKKSICAVNYVHQRPYDPFDDLSRIKLQEFGEVVTEGIYELLHRSQIEKRYDENFWKEYILYRAWYVNKLLKIAEKEHIPFVSESLTISRKIRPMDCLKFVREWEEDINTFNQIKYEA